MDPARSGSLLETLHDETWETVTEQFRITDLRFWHHIYQKMCSQKHKNKSGTNLNQELGSKFFLPLEQRHAFFFCWYTGKRLGL